MKKVYISLFAILMFSLLGRQVWNFGKDLMGREIFMGFVILGGLIYSLKVLGTRPSVVFLALLVCLQPLLVAEELVHVFLFGSLGYFVYCSDIKNKLLCCACVSIGDELFQWLLPWRVCDPKDMVLNIFCCFVGAAVARAEVLVRVKVAV